MRGVYQKLVVSTTAAACSAASWSATRRRTRRCSRVAARAGAPLPERPHELLFGARRRRGGRARRARRRRRRSARATTSRKGSIRAAIREQELTHGRRREGVHARRARAAAAACRSSRQILEAELAARRPRGRPQPLRALPVHAPGAVPDRQARPHRELRGAAREPRQRRRLRGLPAGGRVDPRQHLERLRAEARDDPGHQRPLPRQHPARRHLLGDPAHPRRRDHAREADRASARSRGASTSTARSPAASASTCSARASSSCPTSGRRWSRPASRAATPTARRCGR